MFYSISSVKNIIVCLDNYPNLNQEFFDHLMKAFDGFNVYWVSKENNNWWNRFGIKDDEIVRPKTNVEATLFQNLLRRIIKTNNLKRSDTILLSSSLEALDSALLLLIGTVCLDTKSANLEKDAAGIGVDFIIDEVEDLSLILYGKFVGYATEYYASAKAKRDTPERDKILLGWGWVENKETGFKDYFGGRYFSRRKDSRHVLHPLSLRVIDWKKNSRQSQSFVKSFGFLVNAITEGNFDYITCVPAKPGEKDRFEEILNGFEKNRHMKSLKVKRKQIRLDLLSCIENYTSLRRLGRIERKNRIAGKIKASPEVKSKTIVLLDDVRASGTTITECSNMLLSKGAKEVIPITLAYKPIEDMIVNSLTEIPPYTSCCDWPYVLRFNKTNGEPYYACSAWHPHDEVKHTNFETFANIKEAILDSSEKALLSYDPELNATIPY